MHVDKDEIVGLLRSRGQHDRAANLECALPRQVDTEADAGLLHLFEVNVGEVTRAATGGEADGERDGARGDGDQPAPGS